MYTVYVDESFEEEKFCYFHGFAKIHKIFHINITKLKQLLWNMAQKITFKLNT